MGDSCHVTESIPHLDCQRLFSVRDFSLSHMTIAGLFRTSFNTYFHSYRGVHNILKTCFLRVSMRQRFFPLSR